MRRSCRRSPMKALFDSLRRHAGLLWMLVVQDIASSYRKTLLGLVWILLLPLLFIFTFTFVRLVLMGGRYNVWEASLEASVGLPDVALAIFAGLIVFWMASETVTRCTGAVASGGTYITEMRFPLEILVLSVFGVTFVHTCARLVLFLAGVVVFGRGIPATALLLPIVFLPMIVGTIGVGFLFAAVGAFVRDLQMVVGVAMTALLFLSGVIFPISRVPAPYDQWLALNPIAVTIDQVRAVALWGRAPDWLELGLLFIVALVVLEFGVGVFRRLQGRFADVV